MKKEYGYTATLLIHCNGTNLYVSTDKEYRVNASSENEVLNILKSELKDPDAKYSINLMMMKPWTNPSFDYQKS